MDDVIERVGQDVGLMDQDHTTTMVANLIRSKIKQEQITATATMGELFYSDCSE